MSRQETRLSIVRDWCQSLGVLSAVSISRVDAEMKLAAYVPLLAREFTDAHFTAASLNHVARRAVKGFPTYGELCEFIADWWRETHPVPPAPLALPPPPLLTREPPSPEVREHVRRVAAETIAYFRANRPDDRTIEPRPRHLTPAQLDALNPLPNGAKRAAAP